MKLEIRAQTKALEVRDAPSDSKFIGVLEGYASVFNSDSLPFDGYGGNPWVERVAPGAFAKSLAAMPDVRALWAHRADAVVARAPDTLTLAEDEKGLKVTLSLIDTTTNRDLLANVRAGVVDAMSFGFVPVVVEWAKGAVQDIRTLVEVQLREVSIVAWPAYPAATVGARNAGEQPDIKAEREQFLKTEASAPAPDSPVSVRLWAQRLRAI